MIPIIFLIAWIRILCFTDCVWDLSSLAPCQQKAAKINCVEKKYGVFNEASGTNYEMIYPNEDECLDEMRGE